MRWLVREHGKQKGVYDSLLKHHTFRAQTETVRESTIVLIFEVFIRQGRQLAGYLNGNISQADLLEGKKVRERDLLTDHLFDCKMTWLEVVRSMSRVCYFK